MTYSVNGRPGDSSLDPARRRALEFHRMAELVREEPDGIARRRLRQDTGARLRALLAGTGSNTQSLLGKLESATELFDRCAPAAGIASAVNSPGPDRAGSSCSRADDQLRGAGSRSRARRPLVARSHRALATWAGRERELEASTAAEPETYRWGGPAALHRQRPVMRHSSDRSHRPLRPGFEPTRGVGQEPGLWRRCVPGRDREPA